MDNLCDVAILAGGKGTRLSSRTGKLPKPMVPVSGKPLLLHQIELCRRYGLINIALLVHYKFELIMDFFGDGQRFGVNIQYVIEKEPRGTAGALKDASSVMSSQFIVLYGDTYLDVDLSRFSRFHNSSGAFATLFLHPNDHPYDSDLVEIDKNGNIQKILPYPHSKDLCTRNLVNAALYIISNEGFTENVPNEGIHDIAKNIFPLLLEKKYKLSGYISPEYIKDMGTPDRLDKLERDISNAIPKKLSWHEPRSAIFIDRDGTINKEIGHLNDPNKLELIDGASEAIKILNKAGLLAIVLTNQPVIARGDLSYEGLQHIHNYLETLLGRKNAYLNDIYFCPHHPDKGFKGEIKKLKRSCNCRKPKAGMIESAIKDYNILLSSSWMIGDSTCDIELGAKVGMKTILVLTGIAGTDGKYGAKPDFVMPSIHEAVKFIIGQQS